MNISPDKHYRRTYYNGKPQPIVCDKCWSTRISVMYDPQFITFTCRSCDHADKMPRYDSPNPVLNRRLSEVTPNQTKVVRLPCVTKSIRYYS